MKVRIFGPLFYGAVAALFLAISGPVVHADSVTEGAVLPHYAVVSVGSSASLYINSGPINGAVLVGDGSSTGSSGGNNGSILGGVFTDGTATGDLFTNLQFPATSTTVSTSVTQQAFTDANNLSNAAAALTPNKTYSSTVSGALIINGNGGLNVIDFTSLQNPNITINGTANDTFIFNVSGYLNTNQAMILNGVNASQILWNFTEGPSNYAVFQTSGGNTLYGTFLATGGGDMDIQNFQFSELDLTGQLIDTSGHIQLVSGSKVLSSQPFQTPEPGSLLLLGSGISGLAYLKRPKRNS